MAERQININVETQLRVITAQLMRLCGPELERLGEMIAEEPIFEVREDMWSALERGFNRTHNIKKNAAGQVISRPEENP